MKPRPLMAGNGRLLLLIISIVVLLVLLVSLTNITVAQEPTLPPVTPDAEIGNELFQERCANCHGPAGQGDGELAVNLPAPPADYTAPDFRQTRIPGVMYNTITDGILDSGMPPFGPESSNPISEENRWHLIATVYSLATPPEAILAGQAVYEENCLACHGAEGLGDGPEAANAEADMPDLTSVRYWFNRSNQTVFDELESGAVPDHDYELTDLERWNVVDYARTFSYNYVNPNAPVEPVADGIVSGIVTNGTNGDIVSEAQVLLRGFDQNFQLMVNMTTTVGTDGRYLFELDPVDPNWVYLVSVNYNELGFSSEAGQVTRAEPELDLPITVFDTTVDPSVVQMDRLHVLLSFGQDTVRVDEFYVFSNPAAEVFVGETGDTAAGTVQFALPEGAQNISFQRTFGNMENTIPANEVIQLEEGVFADTFPLNPGNGSLSLIASYDLPYEEGLEVKRPLFYETLSANVIIPGEGVTLSGEGWVDEGLQTMPGGSFSSYTLTGMAANDEIAFTLNGRPELVADVAGNIIPAQNNSVNELIVGGTVLLVVVVAALFIVIRRDTDDYDEKEVEIEQEEIDRLLLAVVDLDDEFEAGQIDTTEYEKLRRKLIGELAAIWPVSQ